MGSKVVSGERERGGKGWSQKVERPAECAQAPAVIAAGPSGARLLVKGLTICGRVDCKKEDDNAFSCQSSKNDSGQLTIQEKCVGAR